MSEETLARIAQIVDTLQPVGDAGAGEPVLAAEWNTLVSGVIDLARVALARERSLDEALAAGYAARSHDHLGALDLRWFEPDTRDLIESGGSGRPTLQADLKQMRGEIGRLDDGLKNLSEVVDTVRRRLDEIAERDDDRRRNFDDLAGRIEVFGDQERRITEVLTTLGTVDERVGEALALRDDLASAGDLGALRRDLDELLAFRSNFTSADGTPFEMRDFERRLAALEEGGTTTRPGGLEFDPGALRAEILAEATGQLDERTRPLGEDLGALQSRVDDVATAAGANTAAIDTTRTDVANHTEQIRATQAAAAALPELTGRTAALETRTAQHQTQLGGLAPLAGRMDEVESGVAELRPLTDRVGAVEGEVATAREALDGLPAIAERVGAVEQFGSDIAVLGSTVNQALSIANRAEAATTTNGARLATVESQADDATRSIARLQTDTQANRETLTLLSNDFEVFRAPGGGGGEIIRPLDGGSPTFRGGLGPGIPR